eukprot:CAMPEP_0201523430 /NCGR_PEP_ID=MMETSP0161_2-20130828/19832_1 /ASSEMBLY_ACC=CAM_ASM_000251 /TAXON_ID=180227 /ORGANISM="Neoparamoeba aestuarina, Strain SoJaBio B1-5/56/2" /LENGTH=521 /DNA_ID=CAMNT_0047922545 /DNA_START=139 /DNA_END=1704 /DNA_ORIENTATION=+
MTQCDEEMCEMEKSLLDGITTMSDRIVFTEGLILDEAQQIGIMADRIVETEYLMSNLTQICIPYCEEENGKPKTKEKEKVRKKGEEKGVRIEEKEMKEGKGKEKKKGKEEKKKEKGIIPGFCTPLGEFNDVLNASLLTFESWCQNTTDGIMYMNDQIGIMADRILFTEGLIMNYSRQIGEMADRIVETEYLASNASANCCNTWGPGEKENRGGSSPFIKEINNNIRVDVIPPRPMKKIKRSPHSSSLQPSMLSTLPVMSEGGYVVGGARGLHVCKSWWNPFCCAMEVMSDMMVQMLQEMGQAGSVSLKLMEEGADIIGVLADYILYLELVIVRMGMEIGYIGDDIVATERMLIAFTTSPVCGNSQQQQPQQQPQQPQQQPLIDERLQSLRELKRTGAELQSSLSLALDKYQIMKNLGGGEKRERKEQQENTEEGVEGNPFGDFSSMVDCMTHMSDTMSSLMFQQMGVGASVMKHIGMVTNDIFQTMDKIIEMIGQIEIMAGRIVETNELMTNLTVACLTDN